MGITTIYRNHSVWKIDCSQATLNRSADLGDSIVKIGRCLKKVANNADPLRLREAEDGGTLGDPVLRFRGGTVGRTVPADTCANRRQKHQPETGTREEAAMLEIGLFHNGASSLPVVTGKDGVTFNDGSLNEVHRASQETLVNQVRQGILAEKLGFQSFWLTEHHFQPEGAEMSPNPLMVQMAVAAHTKRIRLGQAANIIVWHHPVRLAEQIATCWT